MAVSIWNNDSSGGVSFKFLNRILASIMKKRGTLAATGKLSRGNSYFYR